MARPTHYVQATRRDGAEGPAFREFGVVLAWQVMGASMHSDAAADGDVLARRCMSTEPE